MAASPAPSAPKAERSQALDDLIMGTNSSSIVSKRSVERLYYPNEPHYFRYFVRKLQRRAPLINRGYWLRLRAIDVVVRQFLTNNSDNKKKVVINLGCGSDVLPWQSHVRHGSVCDDALFIDIDYPDLMRKKRVVVLETPQLRELLGTNFTVNSSEKDPVMIKSEKYCQLGCDLRELKGLRQILESLVDLSECAVLFVAEVSVTYMDTESADSLVHWASSIGQAEFCLLEQLLPYGPRHPFAQTMLKHFDKLKTPPRSVGQYPTLSQQKERFNSRGWPQVRIWDLWQAWSSDEFVGADERAALDDIEPFDEWEEFMLFARHYFVLHASASADGHTAEKPETLPPKHEENGVSASLGICFKQASVGPKRRFGAAAMVKSALGHRHIVNMMGLGANAREDTYDVYSLAAGATMMPDLPVTGPSPRMCYTVTDLQSFGRVIIGGRGSPTSALSDCWVMSNDDSHRWRALQRLPVPLYRHAALRLGESSLILVAGGKTGPSQISAAYFVFHPEKGWRRCQVCGAVPKPAFGSILCSGAKQATAGSKFHGVVSGGIGKDGLIITDCFAWALDVSTEEPTITFRELKDAELTCRLSLFGATTVEHGNYTMVCGGMGWDASTDGRSLALFSAAENGFVVSDLPLTKMDGSPNPFMIGSSVIVDGNRLIVFGGGATCFSMGTFWDTGVYIAQVPKMNPSSLRITRNEAEVLPNVDFIESRRVVGSTPSQSDTTLPADARAKPSITGIPRKSVASAEEFQQILRDGKPVILESLNLGRCLQDWTPDHMVDRVDGEKQVVVHECQRDTGKMDFNAKNFRYVTDGFGPVMQRVQAGDRLYLRSLSNDKPSELPAKLEDDFPTLASEFELPEQLAYVKKNIFSSVLRVSGRVNMWLHYDVMANVYAQVIGSKRMILFPPSDVSHLAFAPGASSSSLDVFSSLDSPTLAATHPHEACLEPGDVLFLPPLWLHTATPTTDMSVAVNVFFRDLDSGYSAGRDVYGNRDLAAYEKSRQDISKVGKAFQQFPEETRRFYLTRLADELFQLAEGC